MAADSLQISETLAKALCTHSGGWRTNQSDGLGYLPLSPTAVTLRSQTFRKRLI